MSLIYRITILFFWFFFWFFFYLKGASVQGYNANYLPMETLVVLLTLEINRYVLIYNKTVQWSGPSEAIELFSLKGCLSKQECQVLTKKARSCRLIQAKQIFSHCSFIWSASKTNSKRTGKYDCEIKNYRQFLFQRRHNFEDSIQIFNEY